MDFISKRSLRDLGVIKRPRPTKVKEHFFYGLFGFSVFIKWSAPLNFITLSFLRKANLENTFSQITDGRENCCEENF